MKPLASGVDLWAFFILLAMIEKKVIERFWKKVNKTRDCWEWTGAINRDGYGQFGYNKKTYISSRFVMKIIGKEIPEGMFVCHKCDNPACVNPDHLFIATHKDNMKDCMDKGRWKKLKHPSNSAYVLGCRCEDCRSISREYAKERRARISEMKLPKQLF